MEIHSIYQIFINSNNISTDSRKVESNNLFVSLKGPKFNGNQFAKSALEKGACYALVDDKKYAINDKYIFFII